MVQKTLQCCSQTPSFQITYSVSGSEKNYLVCSSCIQLECFSKYIIRRLILENKIKNFQNEQSEIIDESLTVSEIITGHALQSEQDCEHGGFVL